MSGHGWAFETSMDNRQIRGVLYNITIDSTSSTSINGVVVTWVVAIIMPYKVLKVDPPGVRFPLNA